MEKYFKSLSKQLALDEQLVKEFFATHRGEDGRNKEAIFANFLKKYLPARFSCGTGFIKSKDNIISNQQDVIIYDSLATVKLFPDLPSSIFLLETIAGVIEIKTKLDKSDLEKTILKMKKIKEMEPVELKVFNNPGISKPLCCIFAFDSTDLKDLKTVLHEKSNNIKLENRLDFIVVLNKGFMFSGNYYSIVKYGENDSAYRKEIEANGKYQKIRESNPIEIEGMELQENTLLIFLSYILRYLAFFRNCYVDILPYILIEEKSWGKSF